MMKGNTLENMLKTKCTEKENVYGPMEGNTLDNMLKIKCMDKGALNREMEEFIMDNGRMGNKMEKEYSLARNKQRRNLGR